MSSNPGAVVVTQEAVLDALRTLRDPETQRDIVSLGLVKALDIQGGQVAFTIEFTSQPAPVKVDLHSRARKLVSQLPGVSGVQVKMATGAPARPAPHGGPAPPPREEFIPEVKYTVAVSSGKGGVGKSTVAVNLALALSRGGNAVGLVDSDIYGPDIPLMMGARSRPGMFENKIIPVESHGIKLISIGFFVNEEEPIVWRGPMIHSAIQQFLRDVNWGALDYLVFDMPPGTGDAQLSLSQVIPLSGAVVVTTPQPVALLDVRKAIAMFRKMNVPLLGVVENMSHFICPHCGEKTAIFGEGGGEKLAAETGVPLLAEIPLDPETRLGGDEGLPIVIRKPASPQAEAFLALAEAVTARLGSVSTPKLPSIE